MDGVELGTSIDVAAPPDVVWEVLMDVERWPEWTDSVSSVRTLDARPLAVGSRVEVSQPRIPTGTYTVTSLASRDERGVRGLVGRLYRKLTERYLAMEAAGLKARAEGIAR